MSLFHVAGLEDVAVLPVARVGGEGVLDGADWEVVLGVLAGVDVAHAVEVHVAHVVAINVYNLLFLVLDLSCKVVLCLLFDVSKLVPPINIVFLIPELQLSHQLVANGAQENIVELVPTVVHFDLCTVLEGHDLVALHNQLG